jgi:hypothetical protein
VGRSLDDAGRGCVVRLDYHRAGRRNDDRNAARADETADHAADEPA